MRTTRKLLRIGIKQSNTNHTKVKITQIHRQQTMGRRKRKNFIISLTMRKCVYVS